MANSKAEKAYNEVDARILADTIKPLITKEIIEEHKRKPIGIHSDELERVLIYLRRNRLTTVGKYIIVCIKPHSEWKIATLSGVRGVPPKIDEQATFSSRDEAEHGVFLRRLKDLGLN
ncbi:MAG TPA: hypothetical protein VMB26_11065 [Candidatus Binataceae bacterium]|nr:hypothetical protein [Candidatus Binataceae bacterium]